ncbi:MAG: tRNA (cytidine(56)-2'-O)-methyltransferase [Aigarchaeota archaeon]|nr:tRNA (cytidine(56)-2'-O)-methyltransferase [Aigarchaeota archaeon]
MDDLPEIHVLRMGHRVFRDRRISSHVALVARAHGANGVIFSGQYDARLIHSVREVVANWGGPFSVSYVKDWKQKIRELKEQNFFVLISTMYGINLPEAIAEIRKAAEARNLLIVVGSEKMPPDVYELGDMNVAVTSQPSSEVAVLGIMLDWIFGGAELSKEFQDARLKIIPQEKGKNVIKLR